MNEEINGGPEPVNEIPNLDTPDADQEPSITPPPVAVAPAQPQGAINEAPGLTFENARYFRNKDGRVIHASAILRKNGKSMGLTPCLRPESSSE